MRRMHTKFVEHREVYEEMHQLYLDGRPIGCEVTAEKATGLYYWLGTALKDLEKVFRKEESVNVPPWLKPAPKRRYRRRKK